MNYNSTFRAIVVASAVAGFSVSSAHASEIYGAIYGTYNLSGSDVDPSGNNLAVDPDFTSPFSDADGFGAGIGLGKKIGKSLRIEARAAYRNSDMNETNIGTGERQGFDYNLEYDTEITTTTLELFYDFPVGDAFTPYLKGGLGAAFTSAEATIDSTTDPLFTNVLGPAGLLNDEGRYPYESNKATNFAWNIGGGVNYELSDRLGLIAEYQYLNVGETSTTPDAFTDAFGADDYAMHEFLVGVKFGF